MYTLTPRMEQNLRQLLADYHKMFDGGRCQGWELEELIVKAIKSDTGANHLPKWQEAGHDDKADVLVVTNGSRHKLQIKSGQIKRDNLVTSGHRLGRFEGDLNKISEYLNKRDADIVAVPYRKHENQFGRQHIYRICYIKADIIGNVDSAKWIKKGAQWVNHNGRGVEFSLRPSMSWQIWWKIPVEVFSDNQEFTNGQFI